MFVFVLCWGEAFFVLFVCLFKGVGFWVWRMFVCLCEWRRGRGFKSGDADWFTFHSPGFGGSVK